MLPGTSVSSSIVWGNAVSFGGVVMHEAHMLSVVCGF